MLLVQKEPALSTEVNGIYLDPLDLGVAYCPEAERKQDQPWHNLESAIIKPSMEKALKVFVECLLNKQCLVETLK